MLVLVLSEAVLVLESRSMASFARDQFVHHNFFKHEHEHEHEEAEAEEEDAIMRDLGC